MRRAGTMAYGYYITPDAISMFTNCRIRTHKIGDFRTMDRDTSATIASLEFGILGTLYGHGYTGKAISRFW